MHHLFHTVKLQGWENSDQGLQGPPEEEGHLQAHTDSKEWSSSPTQIPRMMLRHDRLTRPMDVRNFDDLGFMKAGCNDIIILPAFTIVNGISSRKARFHNGNGNPFEYYCCWSSACAGISTQSNTLDPISWQHPHDFHPTSKYCSNHRYAQR